MKITINDKEYKIVETLPYHRCGLPAKIVKTDSGERVVVKQLGQWRFWTTPQDMDGSLLNRLGLQ